MWDSSVYNAGFLSINPTNFTQNVYQQVQEKTDKSAFMIDQNALNQVIINFKKSYPTNYSMKVAGLDGKK